jgi:hypothetical protein
VEALVVVCPPSVEIHAPLAGAGAQYPPHTIVLPAGEDASGLGRCSAQMAGGNHGPSVSFIGGTIKGHRVCIDNGPRIGTGDEIPVAGFTLIVQPSVVVRPELICVQLVP